MDDDARGMGGMPGGCGGESACHRGVDLRRGGGDGETAEGVGGDVLAYVSAEKASRSISEKSFYMLENAKKPALLFFLVLSEATYSY